MRNIPGGLIGFILAGAVAAFLASPLVYGQGTSGGGHDPLAMWRDTSPGMSTNAALAFYRLRSSSAAPNAIHPRLQSGANNRRAGGYYPSNQYQPNQRGVGAASSGLPGYGLSSSRYATSKPFEEVRPAPTAFERYWPLLLEGRQDPHTGVIIWSLP